MLVVLYLNCSSNSSSDQRFGLKAIFNQIKLSIQSLKFKYSLFFFYYEKAVSLHTRDYISIFKTAFSLCGLKTYFEVGVFIFIPFVMVQNLTCFLLLLLSLSPPLSFSSMVLLVCVKAGILCVCVCLCMNVVFFNHCFVHGECGWPINILSDSCSWANE